jgi:hypothetical protein
MSRCIQPSPDIACHRTSAGVDPAESYDPTCWQTRPLTGV